MKKWQELTGNFFYLGRSPWFPGTVGSAAGLALIVLINWLGGGKASLVHLAAVIVLFALGLQSSRSYVQEKLNNDPQEVVIDEVLGIFVTFLGMPIHWKSLLFGFVFFRVLDIWKPYPIKKLEKIPNGWGVMLDDVLAGVYANVILQILLRFFW
ncbi:MAG: phosphatidylglycerophosphatase A [Candidatus Omnitrophica bacterium]|nr:phosphatidylglycerophosphatase A [Candidatus Omnitrophota bacterium]